MYCTAEEVPFPWSYSVEYTVPFQTMLTNDPSSDKLGIPGPISQHAECPSLPSFRFTSDCVGTTARVTTWTVAFGHRNRAVYLHSEHSSLIGQLLLLLWTAPIDWLVTHDQSPTLSVSAVFCWFPTTYMVGPFMLRPNHTYLFPVFTCEITPSWRRILYASTHDIFGDYRRCLLLET